MAADDILRYYGFELLGISPILMHADDVMVSDEVKEWREKHKKSTPAGDDRFPSWTWQSYLYPDAVGKYLAVPQELIMATLRNAAAKVSLKGKTTFKSLSQYGMLVESDFCEFFNNGKQIAVADIEKFRDEPFSFHVKEATKLGFSLFVKRATVGANKHVRVRAKFSDWSCRGVMCVNDSAITDAVLVEMWTIAGKTSGLFDWRPSSPKKPGPYGCFTASLKRMKAPKAA